MRWQQQWQKNREVKWTFLLHYDIGGVARLPPSLIGDLSGNNGATAIKRNTVALTVVGPLIMTTSVWVNWNSFFHSLYIINMHVPPDLTGQGQVWLSYWQTPNYLEDDASMIRFVAFPYHIRYNHPITDMSRKYSTMYVKAKKKQAYFFYFDFLGSQNLQPIWIGPLSYFSIGGNSTI